VLRQQGVVEVGLRGGDLEPRPDDRAPALELLQRDVDLLAVKTHERRFEALRAHEPLEVAELDVRVVQELPVHAARLGEHSSLHDAQERVLPARELALQAGRGVFGPHRVPEVRHEPAEIPRGCLQLG
jgi:hypothetical protein